MTNVVNLETAKTDAVTQDADDAPQVAARPLPDPFEVERALEAILFAADTPMSAADLAARTGWPEAAVKDGVDRVAAHYRGRGVELARREDGFAFRTAADTAPYMTSYRAVEKKLSRAAMETLAIVAYHQPVTRAEIENIRGVAVGRGTLDLLIEAGWIQPGRRREVPGRPLTWKTSKKFLDTFGLESLADLPGIDDLKAAGLLDRRPAIETVPMTGELFDEDAANDEVEDGDDARSVSAMLEDADEDESAA